MRKDLVNVEEIWVPCDKDAKGAAITRDGKTYMLASITANGRPLYLAQDVILENIPMTPQELEHKFPPTRI